MTTLPAEAAADRRTRPKDRKQHILAKAAELFRTSGYAAVAMSDIAAGVGIGPSALYRHYRNKQELLVAAFDEALSRYEAAVRDAGDPFEVAHNVVGIAAESQTLDVLWSRDKGHIGPAARADLRLRIVDVSEALTAAIEKEAVPGAVPARVAAWSVLAIVNWPGHKPLPVPPGDRDRMLSAAVRATVESALGPQSTPDAGARVTDEPVPMDPGAGLLPVARREAVLNAAVTMFAVHGYANVSLDDIGEVVGIAGPSVYNHFASKRELLVCGLNRAFEAMWLELGQVLSRSADAEQALDDLLACYTRFAQAHWDLIVVSLSHSVVLDDDEMMALGRNYQDYVGEWRRLVQMCRPGLRADEAQSLVDLALGLIDGVVRVDGLRGPALPGHARQLAKAVLYAPLSS
ncbi:TetR family transcriptional regulator [Gordonia sp. HNM0687]|uniref:TetR family transcriptional regulator n=1 Tax=Gordonia mangrovi TaxID=2665643 RepID=A0A6L7GPD9_9ACTN|nr:TetR/AcrR family transcriptional regulator [Gordonia mangrovi]MXP21483.1 TetR family transcriptional regulator [Gordonia mangrovi]UVF80228.1 TetR/AcrR family transcriptional regulator [Gordonia mangrovi]